MYVISRVNKPSDHNHWVLRFLKSIGVVSPAQLSDDNVFLVEHISQKGDLAESYSLTHFVDNRWDVLYEVWHRCSTLASCSQLALVSTRLVIVLNDEDITLE